ncbi:hypothetical protein F1643_00225 [Azospirillum sp. INR13]|uniref:hypothetical protein n=1 Tax=Azospirillum sp. INR13 TaxID=2596919 RepID=UPI0018921E20|nr:hypothetical protein [Azospirillum sp. INR13]MBF5093114.1 hypothetical protein [Azospirillum sp. INR13]
MSDAQVLHGCTSATRMRIRGLRGGGACSATPQTADQAMQGEIHMSGIFTPRAIDAQIRKIEQASEAELRAMATAAGEDFDEIGARMRARTAELLKRSAVNSFKATTPAFDTGTKTITREDLARYKSICPELVAFTHSLCVALNEVGNAGWEVSGNADTSEDDMYSFGSTNDYDLLNEVLNEHQMTIQLATDLTDDD